MVLFNYATRELTAKIVYYGPGLCGKTTNLEQIHKSLPEKTRGKMLSLATQTDRTLFFDFLPIDLGQVKGMKTRVQLYTVPGQVFYDATRKLVLKGADGIVFVADSQKEMMDSNLDSWENLKHNLAENNLDIHTIPLVMQYNKQDLPNVLPAKELNRLLNGLQAPHYEAIAVQGAGVQETLKGIAKLVLQTLSKRYGREEQTETAEEASAVAAPQEQRDPMEKLQFAMAGARGAPSERVELAVEEEVKELPQAEEMEAPEDIHLALEPMDAIGELEEVPDLREAIAENPRVEAIASDVITEYKPAPRAENSPSSSAAAASVSVNEVSTPVEVTVSKDGQEIKLQLSINLKIRVVSE